MLRVALVLAFLGAISTAETTRPAAATTDKERTFSLGENVEVKWGPLWKEALIVRKKGDWTLVAYPRPKTREWVEPYRIRKLGSTEDNIGPAEPNVLVFGNEGPPREKPGADNDDAGNYKSDRA